MDLGIAVLACLLCCALFSVLVIKYFSFPLYGEGDTSLFEYDGYYFTKYLSFTPFPELNFHNNGTMYPVGTNQAFQPWGVEWNLFSALLNLVAGMGPWLQIYYLASLFLS